jgi:hypothetical protein
MRHRPTLGLLTALMLAAGLTAAELNVWPLFVGYQHPDGRDEGWQAAGPLLFGKPGPGHSGMIGFRPLHLHIDDGAATQDYFLFPFFSSERSADYATTSFFKLVNHRREVPVHGAPTQGFDLWPFWFSRQTGDPDTSYRAFLPLHGTIKNRFGRDSLSWTLFPLYADVAKNGAHTTYTPWPFIRRTHGAGQSGFEFWPLGGWRGIAGEASFTYALWSFVYSQRTGLNTAEPEEKFGVLPFYTRDKGPGHRSENWLWPFFGYTHRTAPYRYDEQRFLWPLIVRGRGDHKTIDRFAPFYTHSVVRGYDKTWVLWPLLRHATWEERGLAHERNEVLFFLWWSLEQRSLTHPDAAPATKRHLWPLFSAWDNGAGRRQFQLLSPVEVFFPHNDRVRQLYSPLFAIYRHDRRGDDEAHASLLWGAVTWHRTANEREFHLGPLLGIRAHSGGARAALLGGVLGVQRSERGWRPFLFDFSSRPGKVTAAASPP